MAESTLTLGYLDFAHEASFEWGYGANFTALTGYVEAEPHTDKALIIDRMVQEAYRMMLNPPVLATEQGEPNHSWRFLRPLAEINAWPAQAAVSGRTLSWVSEDDGSQTTVIQTASGTFYPSMVGRTIVTTQGSFLITDYVSSTQVRINAYYALDSNWGTPATWTMVAGDYRLPDDFGGHEGPLTEVDASQHRHPIPWTGEIEIRSQRNYIITQTGYPRFAAALPRQNVRLITIDATPADSTNQPILNRFDVKLWPIPDTLYTLRYPYIKLVNKLTVAAPYPIGGMMFSELMMAATRAVVEKRRHKVKGTEYAHFMETLAAAVEHDRHAIATEYFGNTGQRTTDYHGRHSDDTLTVTVNGVTP